MVAVYNPGQDIRLIDRKEPSHIGRRAGRHVPFQEASNWGCSSETLGFTDPFLNIQPEAGSSRISANTVLFKAPA